MSLDSNFLVTASELTLRFSHALPQPVLAFKSADQGFDAWRKRCTQQLAQLLAVTTPRPGSVSELRRVVHAGVRITALRMEVDERLSIPAYFLQPDNLPAADQVVMAIHGHGEVEACIGVHDDYHHQFGLTLAQRGYQVLCPELRGFGVLNDLAAGLNGYRLDYWRWGTTMAYSLVTDGFLTGSTLLGETIEDLLRWEHWLAYERNLQRIAAVGISYGGDLALMYPVFSTHVERIFASGTLGSFAPIFAQCYNAPAHCIPRILQWMDRADIAGLNAPRPLAIHYGALDTPSAENFSAAYNASVGPSLADLKQIYAALGAEEHVVLAVSPGMGHEMDVDAVLTFLARPFGTGSAEQ